MQCVQSKFCCAVQCTPAAAWPDCTPAFGHCQVATFGEFPLCLTQFGGMSGAERNSVIRVSPGCPALPTMKCLACTQGKSCSQPGQRLLFCCSGAPSSTCTVPIHAGPAPMHPTFSCCPSLQLVINISAAFSAFERWSVGLGVEHQLSGLRRAVGLPDFKVRRVYAWAAVGCVSPAASMQFWCCSGRLHRLGDRMIGAAGWFKM